MCKLYYMPSRCIYTLSLEILNGLCLRCLTKTKKQHNDVQRHWANEALLESFCAEMKTRLCFSYLEWSQTEIYRHPPHWLDDPKLCFLVNEWFPIKRKREYHFSGHFSKHLVTLMYYISKAFYLFYYFWFMQNHSSPFWHLLFRYLHNKQIFSIKKKHCWAQQNIMPPVWLQGTTHCCIITSVSISACCEGDAQGPRGTGRNDGAARLSRVAK